MPATVRSPRSRKDPPRVIPLKRTRFWIICLCFAAWACAIAVRLFMLQIVHHQEYVERAQKQQQRTFEVAPRRGVLYDRNLHELAMTVQVDSIFADPSEIDDKPAAARTLAALVHVDPEDTCRRPLCTAMVRPTMSGMIMERRDQVLIGRRSFFWLATCTFLARGKSTNGPFFSERGTDDSPVVYYCRLFFLR